MATASTPQPIQHCDFCGYTIPDEPIHDDGSTVFCSSPCASAYRDGEEPFAGHQSHKLVSTGVNALDSLLPNGIPANSFVLLSGDEGIRHRGLQTELVWRTLQRGEPAVIVSFVDQPTAIIEHFLTMGWNVLPALEQGTLRIIDCFTNRLLEDHQDLERKVAWNEFLERFLEDTVEEIQDTSDLISIDNRLHSTLDSLDMVGTGVVVFDSLNELSLQNREHQTEQFIKEIRADLCKRLFVPIFASTTITQGETFSSDRAYMFDGIVDMRRAEDLVAGLRLKQISVRKMDGVLYTPEWECYEKIPTSGFSLYDPNTELNSVYGTQSRAQSTQPTTQPPVNQSSQDPAAFQ